MQRRLERHQALHRLRRGADSRTSFSADTLCTSVVTGAGPPEPQGPSGCFDHVPEAWHGVFDRLTYAALGGLFGALLGLLGWFLYGLSYSLRYDGPGMDPVMRHWVAGLGTTFAVLGFVFGARSADWLGDALSAVFHFEMDQHHKRPSAVFTLVLLALLVAAIWFSAPGR